MPTITIDGQEVEVEEGAMVIQAADQAGIPIPRFCYHKKLSIAANCRMCLVEVENAPKVLPACATPVADGMNVFTKSKSAKNAQRSVMEFLLINHPLDCPICDQGGECELQDVAMGYGGDISRFTEGKRAVAGDDLGSLIATDMTRCIHCTRCVRFGDEVAGLRELGATGRGEDTEIGTYIEHSVSSEISGNVIDICPVGALTSKPFRFAARTWELNQHDSIAAHDCLGSNIHIHTRRGEVMRVVPHENEAINEVWISDRDRFSYEGIHTSERLAKPLVKQGDKWIAMDWQPALEFAAEGLQRVQQTSGADQIAGLISANATVEECYLLQKLVRELGGNYIEHRLHETDFSDQTDRANYPGIDIDTQAIANQQAVLTLGLNMQQQAPILAIKLRQAARNNAAIMSVDMLDHPVNFKLTAKRIVAPSQFVFELAGIAKALVSEQQVAHIPAAAQKLLDGVKANETHQLMAEQLLKASPSLLLLGANAHNHPQAAAIRALAEWVAALTDSQIGYVTEGANAAGAWLAGCLPHRGPAAAQVNAGVAEAKKAYVLFGIEPGLDCVNPQLSMTNLANADFVIACSAYESDDLKQVADVIFPIGTFAETSGTFVNWQGTWQSFAAAVKAQGEARPGWKVLRVLGNFLEIDGFDYTSSEQVRDELQKRVADMPEHKPATWLCPDIEITNTNGIQRITDWPLYRSDTLVRHSQPLQACAANLDVAVYMSANTAKQLGKSDTDTVQIRQADGSCDLTIVESDIVPDGCVYIPAGFVETAALGESFAEVEIS